MRAFTDKEVLERISGLPTFTGFPNGIVDVWIRAALSVTTKGHGIHQYDLQHILTDKDFFAQEKWQSNLHVCSTWCVS